MVKKPLVLLLMLCWSGWTPAIAHANSLFGYLPDTPSTESPLQALDEGELELAQGRRRRPSSARRRHRPNVRRREERREDYRRRRRARRVVRGVAAVGIGAAIAVSAAEERRESRAIFAEQERYLQEREYYDDYYACDGLDYGYYPDPECQY